jgi:C1A family cysteine protease
MSEQFLYWACKQKDGIPNDPGTWLEIAFEKVLSQGGCCLDSTWKYQPDVVSGDETRGSPPATAAAEAAKYVVKTFKRLAPTSVPDIRSHLQKGICVAFSIPVYHSWTLNPEVQKTGDIVLPIPNEDDHNEGHAMCFVGYEDLPGDTDTGGGRFLVRNSWNSYWATESKLGIGYGTIPYSYIAKFGSEAYSID